MKRRINSMKICPKCQTKNQDESNFCKKCGFKLLNHGFDDKREKVLGGRKKSFIIPIFLTILVISVIGIGYWILSTKSKTNPKLPAQPKISERIDYSGQTIKMTDIQAKVDKGNIFIPVDIVIKNRLIRFEYEGNGLKYPLLAYLTPSGRVVTAISMCEPCRSTRFHINENKLVCNACYTEWNIETLKGIQGGCLNYPPDVIPSKIEKGNIVIDEKVVLQWKPRV